MLRKLSVSIWLPVVTAFAVAACAQGPAPVAWSGGSPNPSPAPAAATATSTPTPTAATGLMAAVTPGPAVTASVSRKPAADTIGTRIPTQQSIAADARKVCPALRGPIVSALSGLIALRLVAMQQGSADGDVRRVQGEALARLADLKRAAQNAVGVATNRTLQADLRGLASAAGTLHSRIQSVKDADRAKLAGRAADTGALERATQELRPACGEHWN